MLVCPEVHDSCQVKLNYVDTSVDERVELEEVLEVRVTVLKLYGLNSIGYERNATIVLGSSGVDNLHVSRLSSSRIVVSALHAVGAALASE